MKAPLAPPWWRRRLAFASLTLQGGFAAIMLHRHETFCRHIADGRNQTQAAIAGGYAKKSATVTASRLMKQPHIRAEIARLKSHGRSLGRQAGSGSNGVSAPIDGEILDRGDQRPRALMSAGERLTLPALRPQWPQRHQGVHRGRLLREGRVSRRLQAAQAARRSGRNRLARGSGRQRRSVHRRWWKWRLPAARW